MRLWGLNPPKNKTDTPDLSQTTSGEPVLVNICMVSQHNPVAEKTQALTPAVPYTFNQTIFSTPTVLQDQTILTTQLNRVCLAQLLQPLRSVVVRKGLENRTALACKAVFTRWTKVHECYGSLSHQLQQFLSKKKHQQKMDSLDGSAECTLTV